MSNSADLKPDRNENMPELQADAIVNESDLKDVKPNVNASISDLQISHLGNVEPNDNTSESDLQDVKPYSYMNVWTSEDVKPVVQREEPDTDSLEDEKPCIEALRTSLLLSEENFRQRESVTFLTSVNSRSAVTGCNTEEGHTWLISGTDIKDEETENCEGNGHPDDLYISERHGREKQKALRKEEELQVSKEQDPRSQIHQADPEHCEADSLSSVEQLETPQSGLTPGQSKSLTCPNIQLTDQERHVKQARSDEYVQALQEEGHHNTIRLHLQSSPSVALLENSITSASGTLAVEANCQPLGNTLYLMLKKQTNEKDCQITRPKQNTASKRYPLISKLLCFDKKRIEQRRGSYSSETLCIEEGQPRSCTSTNLHPQVSQLYIIKNHETIRHADVGGLKSDQSGDGHSYMQTVTSEKLYKSEVCGKGLGLSHNLLGHQTTHTDGNPNTCNVWDKDFGLSSPLVTHKRSHTSAKTYTCYVCGKGFEKKRNLTVHKEIHRVDMPFKCYVCGKGFPLRSYLLKHIKTHTGQKHYRSEGCGKGFGLSHDLLSHQTTHTDGNTYTCSVWDKNFGLSSPLLTHERPHTGEKPFKCDECGNGFEKERNLIMHKRTHTVDKPFKCNMCGKGFALRKYLLAHRKTQTCPMPYKCDVCGRGFEKKINLIPHMRTHTVEKPFKCYVCGKKFALRGYLLAHIRTHPGEKPYKCDVCGKGFEKNRNLIMHKKTHTIDKLLKCGICGKGFNRSNNLLRHKRIHTGEKPYKCDICGKGFVRSCSLTGHKRTHTGERPYQCDVYGKGFVTSSALQEKSHSQQK